MTQRILQEAMLKTLVPNTSTKLGENKIVIVASNEALHFRYVAPFRNEGNDRDQNVLFHPLSKNRGISKSILRSDVDLKYIDNTSPVLTRNAADV